MGEFLSGYLSWGHFSGGSLSWGVLPGVFFLMVYLLAPKNISEWKLNG